MPSPRPPSALAAGLLTIGTVGPPPSLTATSTQSSLSRQDDPDEAAGQRRSVAQRIADKFTEYKAGITRRSLVDASLGEVADQTAASHANARGCIREHLHARRTHLHEHPAPSVDLYEPGMSGNAP